MAVEPVTGGIDQQAGNLANPAGVAAGAGGGFSDFMSKNPNLGTAIGIGAAALPLALNRGNQLPYQGPIQGIATQLSSAYPATQGTAQTLEQPIITGVLPPGAQAAVDVAKRKADADVKSRYANLGLTGSTMEADQLALNSQNVAAMQFQIEQQMFKSGIDAGRLALDQLKLEDSIYGELMKAQMASDKSLTDAIGGFAKAAGTALGMAGGFAIGGPPGAMAGGALGGAAGGALGADIAQTDTGDYKITG